MFQACHGVLSNSYCHQITNDFKKFLEQEGAKNTAMIAIHILVVICIHIELIKLLKNGTTYAKNDLERKLFGRDSNLDWRDNAKIEEAIAVDNDDKNEVEISG